MKMTLRELRAWHEDKYNTKFLSSEDYQVHFDAIALIDAHLSQPQPVAQGEAVVVTLAEAERIAQHAYVAGKRGYTFPEFVDELRSAATPTIPTEQDAVDVEARTGHPEADRVLDRMNSSDPDFDDCAAACALIYRLVGELKGPDGFATWNDACVAERVLRVAAEKATIPTGHRVVPVEPTDEMLLQGVKEGLAAKSSGADPAPWCKASYKAMLAAAPDAGGV
jgi:hypothetical protein